MNNKQYYRLHEKADELGCLVCVINDIVKIIWDKPRQLITMENEIHDNRLEIMNITHSKGVGKNIITEIMVVDRDEYRQH